jgi:Fe-S oxidoreductase
VAQNREVVAACKPFLSDKKYNVYSIYRSANSIDYGDLVKQKTKTILFPGCSMGTFFPKLTRALYQNLAKTEPDLGILMDCCQKPLKDLGLNERYEKATAKLDAKLDAMGAQKIITACPSCLAVLRERFKDREVVSCYSELSPVKDQVVIPSFGKEVTVEVGSRVRDYGRAKITVHDSCSDREYGLVGPQVRRLLSQAGGAEIVEMVHSGKNSMCCGSGGLVPAFDPALATEVKRRRIDEAESSGAEMMVTYCATCASAFRSGGDPSKVEVRHALELLLGVKEDYDAIQKNLEKLFGPGKRKELYDRLIQNSPSA